MRKPKFETPDLTSENIEKLPPYFPTASRRCWTRTQYAGEEGVQAGGQF